MADNYIERRMEEIAAGGQKGSSAGTNLDTLITRNRSTRGFDSSYMVDILQLRAIVSVNSRIASAKNRQLLRFRLVTKDEAAKVTPLLGIGGALPELHLPLPGTEPNAYIIICSAAPEEKFIEFDEGISAQTMLLKATEMGLSGLIVKCFDADRLTEALNLKMKPLTVIAIGRKAEKAELVTVNEGDSLKYYRKDGRHFVPKISWEDLIIK